MAGLVSELGSPMRGLHEELHTLQLSEGTSSVAKRYCAVSCAACIWSDRSGKSAEQERLQLATGVSQESVPSMLDPGNGAAQVFEIARAASRVRAMPTTSSGRDSRRGSKSGVSTNDAVKSPERREKGKSSQSHSTAYNNARRGSVQPNLGSVPERPRLQTRTHSAPSVEVRKGASSQPIGRIKDADQDTAARDFAPQAGGGAMADGQDEDEVAGVVGAVRQYQPFQSPEVSEGLPEINIAVIGAEGVGKSTFVQKAFDLPYLPLSLAAQRKIPVEGSAYLVRLLELPIDDVDVDDDDTIVWPETIEYNLMPRIDGAIALYDVQDKGSFDDVPEVLNAIKNSALPSVLVSSKCDTPSGERELDPLVIEQQARRSISGISTLQTSETGDGAHKLAISMILRAIILGNSDDHTRSASATRKRAQSNAVRSVSPRPPSGRGHARASSEYTGSIQKEQKHARHDSSIASYGNSNSLRVPQESQEDMHRSFLFEESASEASVESDRSPVEAGAVKQPVVSAPNTPALSENGATFEELVVRLLAQPASKADSKFSAIFLALYRKFAAPGRLLEAILDRFDMVEKDGLASMITTVTQLRYLAILEQWVGQYPGDFAFPRTKRQMRSFIARISQIKLFAVAAKEMSSHLDMVQEDDDTDWGYCDKDREPSTDNRISTGSTSSTLTGDHSFSFIEDMSGTTLADDKSTVATAGGDTIRSTSGSSTTSSQIMLSTEAAQKVAQMLQPTPKQPIMKLQWRDLDEQPDDVIAKELTRMDWVMFSSIRPRDLVRSVSTSEKVKYKNLVNVNRMSEHFNHVAAWVQNYVLFRDKPKHRALMLEKFMRIARKLRELNNYNSLGAVIAGINSSYVQRLAATRELIPQNVGRDWARLEILMGPSRSHAPYRMAWENTSTERIPYLPLHRRDLVSAEQANATFIGDEKDGRVNWKKFEIMGEVVVSMQRAQGMPYKGLGGSRGEARVRELVLDVILEKDEEALHERSVQLEPSAGSGGTSEKFKQFFKR
ncbi:hypothetical protein LTR85_007634 [Meristemomyces frigidus]|nr:hypothetical protein LTR85_007634 [Meristemomyces frigidus]